jgi:hypothetical protein
MQDVWRARHCASASWSRSLRVSRWVRHSQRHEAA